MLYLSDIINFDQKFYRMNRIEITSERDLEHAIEKSFEEKVLIFKHSTRCGISRMALRGFERDLEQSSYDSYYYLDLIAHKSLSNEIAEKFGVKHESPQLLYIQNGEVELHQSHHKISI